MLSDKNIFRAHLAVFITNLIYGLNFTIAKGIMPQYISPLGLVTLRVCISTMLFFIVQAVFIREKTQLKDHWKFMLCGLFGVATNQMLFFKGLSLTSPINGAIIMTTNPILVLIIAAIIIKERITLRKVGGIVLGLLGALLLLVLGHSFSLNSRSLGDFYIFLNAMSYGIFLVIAKPMMKSYHPITVITWSFFYGMFMVIPFGFPDLFQVFWHEIPVNIWLGITYVIIAVTFFAFLLNTIALKTLSPSVVSFYIYLQPLFATLISLLNGKDNLTWVKVVSSVMIFSGVYLVSIPKKEKII